MEDMGRFELISYIAVVAGALNWGLEGLSSFAGRELNVIDLLAEAVRFPELASLFYLAVGIAGLYQVYYGYQLYHEDE